MKKLSFPTLLLAASFCFAENQPPLFLKMGEQRCLQNLAATRMSVGNSAVIRILPRAPNACTMVKGIQEGFTDLWIFHSQKAPSVYPIHVLNPEKAKYTENLEQLGKRGFTFRFRNQRLLITGTVHSKAESELLAGVLASGLMDDATELSDELLTLSTTLFVQRLGRDRVEKKGQRIYILGQAGNELESSWINQVVSDVLPHVKVIQDKNLDYRPQARLKVTLLNTEYRNSRQLGIQWSEAIPNLLSFQQGQITSLVDFGAALHALEQKGFVKILSEPNMVLREGEDAELSSGGEIPIPTRIKNIPAIEWKRFGLKVGIKLLGISGKILRLKISTQNNYLDHSSSLNGIPAINVNEFSSTFQVELGKPLIMSGLRRAENGQSTQGIPGTTGIMGLNKIFGVENTTSKTTELAMTIIGDYDR